MTVRMWASCDSRIYTDIHMSVSRVSVSILSMFAFTYVTSSITNSLVTSVTNLTGLVTSLVMHNYPLG